MRTNEKADKWKKQGNYEARAELFSGEALVEGKGPFVVLFFPPSLSSPSSTNECSYPIC